ncbi:MAG: T9SS type A sorting domain-containing protein [Bacteroidota bacterium]|jgi:hypothetical protein
MKLVFYIIIITLCSAFYLNSKAQQVYFNEQYPNSSLIGFTSEKYINDTIYCMGYFNDNSRGCRLFCKFDKEGNMIFIKTILKKNNTSYLSGGSPTDFVELNKNFYYGCYGERTDSIVNNENFSNALLIKLNEKGDTVLIKEFSSFNSYRQGFNSIFFNKNTNSLVVLGSLTKLDSLNQRQVKVYIANMDTLGNIIWEHEYGFNNQITNTPQIIPSDDGGYYIPGSVDDTAAGIQYDYYLLKIDSVGNVVYQRQWGVNDKYEGLNGIYTAESGNVIGTGSEATTGFYYYKRPFLCKFNSTGIMTERRYLFNSEGESSLYKIFKHQNHFLTLCFYQPNIDLYRKIAFVEFGENLDSINTTIFDFNGNQNIYDIIQLPDKGYLLGGFFKNPGQTPFQNAWLMRIDSNLCANTACIPVGIEELYQTFGQKTNINVYPNPATNVLNIVLPNSSNYASFEFIEITGKVILHGQLNNSLNSIDINQYCKGIYFLKVKISEQEIITKKIIISK